MEEVIYGHPSEGRPIQIPLLRALNTALGLQSTFS